MNSTDLVEVEDAHFLWMQGNGITPAGLTLAPGGVEAPEVLRVLRRMTRQVREAGSRGSWMMVDGSEVVGLCSYKQPPRDGVVEIGYGVAASRRRQGHATRAVAAMLIAAQRDPAVNRVIASTAVDNIGSQRALERNGFAKTGTTFDPDDGELLLWAKDLP